MNFALGSQLQTDQILTNDVQMLILFLPYVLILYCSCHKFVIKTPLTAVQVQFVFKTKIFR